MQRRLIRFYRDEHGDWIAELECGHTRHFRHNPPWTNHPWVTTEEGRERWVGTDLECKECESSVVSSDMPKRTLAEEGSFD
jgi:hypothetical protein